MSITAKLSGSWAAIRCAALLSVGLALLLGCSSESDLPEDDPNGLLRQTEQAATPVPDQTLTLSVEVPSEVLRESASVVSLNKLTLGDRAQIADASAANRGELIVGMDAKVGTVRAATTLRLRDRARVTGDAIAGGAVVRGANTVVTGTVQQNKPITRVSTSWSVTAPGASQGPITVENDKRKLLPPGTYGALIVRARGTLTLESGVYVFQSVLLEPQSQLRIATTTGPAQVFVKQSFTHRGSIGSATPGIPQLVVGYLGTTLGRIESSFNGVLIAPNADLLFSAAQPQGHRAFVQGKNVTFEPDAIIHKYPFDWTAVLGPSAYKPPPADTPALDLPKPTLSSSYVDVPGDATGSLSTTQTTGTAVTFQLPATYPVAGGTLGNGTVILTFSEAGGTAVTCTYKGGSPTAQPISELDLNLGRTMHFQSCSDGLPAGTNRRADALEVTVTPSPGYPVSVVAPITKDGSCGEMLELLSPAETYSMVSTFDWSTRPKVAEKDAQDRLTLYYAWIYIASEDDLHALRALYIHRLSRPLFADELSKFDDRCGALTNPGDGRGQFVPALIPGVTYNKMIDALTSPDIDADREVFEAVILRQPPVSARTPQGSVDLNQLKASGFRYLGYEADPFAPQSAIVQNGFIAKIITDVLSWIGQAAQDAAAWFGQAFGDLSMELTGRKTMVFHMHALNLDAEFARNEVIRSWGGWRGTPLAAEGVEVTMLQWFGPMIPAEVMARTNMTGKVTLDIAMNGIRGNGLCMELGSPAALITDFLVPTGMCDFRSWDPTTGQQGLPFNWLYHVIAQPEHLVRSEHPRVNTLYQSDDVYQYSKQVIGFTPKQARIMSGAWAETFTPSASYGRQPFAPCLNYGNTFSDHMALAAALGAANAGAVAGSFIPALGNGVAAAVAAGVTLVGASVILNTDIVMPDSSATLATRYVATHEYGHYLLCSMMQSYNEASIDHLIWGTIFAGANYSHPLVNLNEAFADFITGQVVGASVYHWFEADTPYFVKGATRRPLLPGGFCTPPLAPSSDPWCWDTNLRGSTPPGTANDHPSIFLNMGRMATMFHDAFDGSGLPLTTAFPNNADHWAFTSATGVPPTGNLPLVLASSGYNNTDAHLERVVLPGPSIRRFAEHLATDLHRIDFGVASLPLPATVDEAKIYRAVNETMLEAGNTWCDRSRVLALHQPTNTLSLAPTVAELLRVGQFDPFLAGILGPPPTEARRLNAADCQPCPAGLITADDGTCVPGCPPDVVLDGATIMATASVVRMPFDTNTSPAGDLCPEVFILRIDNFGSATMASMVAQLGPAVPDAASCALGYSLTARSTAGTTTTTQNPFIVPGQGTFITCPGGSIGCTEGCSVLPSVTYGPTSGHTVEFEALAGASLVLNIQPVVP